MDEEFRELERRFGHKLDEACPKNINECDMEKASAIFEELELLQDETKFLLAAKLLTDKRLKRVFAIIGEPALKYLQYTFDMDYSVTFDYNISLDTIRKETISALGLLEPDVTLPMLQSLILENRSQEIKNLAALELAKNKCFDVLNSAFQEKNEMIRLAVLKALNQTRATSEKMLLSALEDPVPGIRREVVSGFYYLGIKTPLQAVILARSLEDTNAEISQAAIDYLPRYRLDPELTADTLIDTLVLRNEELPPEHFNPNIFSKALQALMLHSTRLESRILHNLCELAYKYEDAVQTRSILVAKRLNENDFVILVQAKAEENPDTTAKILRLLGHTASIALPQQKRALNDYTESLKKLEVSSMTRWDDMARQSKTSFWIRNILTILYFAASLVIIGFGLWQLGSADDIWIKGIGGAVSALTAIGGMLGKFWKAPMEDIKSAAVQQAGLEAAFIGYMTRVGQIRLLFEQQYTQGEISVKDMAKYQKMLSEAQKETEQQLLQFRVLPVTPTPEAPPEPTNPTP